MLRPADVGPLREAYGEYGGEHFRCGLVLRVRAHPNSLPIFIFI